MKKKLFCLGLSLLFAFFTACGGAPQEASAPAEPPSAPPSAPQEVSEPQSRPEDGEESTPVDLPAQPVDRRVAYFTSWSAYERAVEVSDMDASRLTHINFAFANLSSEGEVTVGDSWVDTDKPFGDDTWEDESRGHFGQLKQLKQTHPDVKTLISVGGWTWSGNFSQVASTAEGRAAFARSALDFLLTYGFDGVDLDWEFPVEGGNGIPHRPEDKQNYTLLVKAIRAVLDEQEQKDGRHYLLTIAGGPNSSFTQNTELSEMMQHLDFINLMTYDYHGGWDAVTGHNAPLYSDDGSCVSATVDAYRSAGVAAKDMNLGLAFYGRGWGNVSAGSQNGYAQPGQPLTGKGPGLGTWEGGVFDFWDLAQNYVGKNGYTRIFDDKAKAPYLYNGSVFISYDDEESIKIKLDYAKQQGLGGVMFWEFSGDKEKTLQSLWPAKGQAVGEASSAPEQSSRVSEPPVQSETEASGWDAQAVYQKGDVVSYQGSRYEAKWWTQGEAPAEVEWGPWTRLP